MPKFLLLLVVSTNLFAGYRVYQLKVTHLDSKGKPQGTEIVLSNLDHFQYENYHAGYRWDRVDLLDTWFCPGDTSRHEYCPKPKNLQHGLTDHMGKRGFLANERQPVIP